MSLEWSDPPPPKRWASIVLELRRHPGRWARIESDVSERVAYSASGALRHHECEATVRKQDDGRGWSVWGRWVCPSEATSDAPEAPQKARKG